VFAVSFGSVSPPLLAITLSGTNVIFDVADKFGWIHFGVCHQSGFADLEHEFTGAGSCLY